jgi:hypothetical protein
MQSVSDAASESIKHLGESFFLAYYLPAAVFVAVHSVVLLPVGHSFVKASPPATSPLLDSITSLIEILLFSLLAGIVLLGLNSMLLRGFEGKLAWLQNGLMSRRVQRNRELCQQIFGDLTQLKEKYRDLLVELYHETNSTQRLKIEQKLIAVEKGVRTEYKNMADSQPIPILPHTMHRVTATTFGNVYARAEEYAYTHYGVDAVLFWTRLRSLMYQVDEGHSQRLTHQKALLDLLVNSCFLSGVLVFEAIVTILTVLATPLTLPDIVFGYFLLLIILLGIVLSFSFYQAGVGAIRVLGELVNYSYDVHRGLILEAFKLKQPADLRQEQVVWFKLAAFIQHGDDFYFPREACRSAPPNVNEDEDNCKQPDNEVGA